MAVRLVARASRQAAGFTLAAPRRSHWPRQGPPPMTLTVLGVDIGATGALALLDERGALLDVYDMPCLHDGPKNRRTVNAPLLAEIVYKSHATVAFVERVGPRPGEGSVGAFAFGDARGVVRGVLAAALIPFHYLTPAQWKRVVGLPPGKKDAKDLSRSEAIRRWPAKAQAFKRKCDDGRADAALIAVAGLRLHPNDLRAVPRDDDGQGPALPGVLGGPGELLRRRDVQ